MSVSTNLSRHMSSVQDYRERLAALQGAWDTLSLLSHLSGDGTDMGGTRQAFEKLTTELVRNLAIETRRKTLLGLKAKGQIAIDIMVRNLYERTADIGFLCTDEDIRAYVTARTALPPEDADTALRSMNTTLRRRLREYVAKYSVYHDVVLLAPDGQILLRLDDSIPLVRSTDPLIAATLTAREGYVETFRHSDLLPRQSRSLIYSYRITEAGRTIAVLCLCFRFEDEVARIFAKLQEDSDWTLFALVDRQGEVIASSDPWQLPVGAPLTLSLQEDGAVVRFAGREYLAITRRTQGYQGYQGPGWYGQAMIPVEHAFDHKALEGHARVPNELLTQLRDSAAIFSDELRRIPRQADEIQRELNRAVWNSNVRLGQRTADNGNFAKVLLWEIGNAGRRTQETFDRSILDLQETVISSIFDDAQLLAALAVDVLDRNLYERANDCRWWALTKTLTETLAGEASQHDQATAILRHINGLYTVYHNIILFDAQRGIVAASNPDAASRTGTTINEDWASRTLALRGVHDFAISDFKPSALYANRHTLIFGAAIRAAAGRTVGGIGIVFDSQPQLTAMLRDALPRSESGETSEGCIGLFVDQDMRVIAATSQYQSGDVIALPADLIRQPAQAGARIVTLKGTNYALGMRRTAGYREYRGLDAFALVLIPLGPAVEAAAAMPRFNRSNTQRHGDRHDQTVDIATFRCVDQRLGVLRDQVVEAVDGSRLRTIPGSPSWHAGLLMYRDMPVPVIDLARLLEKSSRPTLGDVVVARLPATDQFVGLLIHELADIPEVSLSRMLPFSERSQRTDVAVIDRAVRPEAPDEPVLFILNLEQLILRTQSASARETGPAKATAATPRR